MSDRKTISESTANDKATCVITLDEQITRYARRIAAQVCGGYSDDNTIGGVVDALIIKETVRRRLTDSDMKEEGVFSATVEDRKKLRHELVKATCVVTLDEQITRYARRIAAQVCGGFADNNTVGGVVDALIIKEAVRRRLTDSDMKEEGVFSATVEDREKLRKRDLNAGVHGKKVVE